MYWNYDSNYVIRNYVLWRCCLLRASLQSFAPFQFRPSHQGAVTSQNTTGTIDQLCTWLSLTALIDLVLQDSMSCLHDTGTQGLKRGV
jgi:hypothetical protein